MLFPTFVTMGWMMMTLLVIKMAEGEETCNKGDADCGSDHYDKYSQGANMDNFEVN